MEKQRFEDSWKDSFKDAEVTPPDSLWTNIELDLEKEDGSKMKRRVLFFQLLAAASVAFAMTFAGVGIYFMLQNNDTPNQLTVNTNPTKSTPNVTNQTTSGTPATGTNGVEDTNTAITQTPIAKNNTMENASRENSVSPDNNASAEGQQATVSQGIQPQASTRSTDAAHTSASQRSTQSANRAATQQDRTVASTADQTTAADRTRPAADRSNVASAHEPIPTSDRTHIASANKITPASDRPNVASTKNTTHASDRTNVASARTTAASGRATDSDRAVTNQSAQQATLAAQDNATPTSDHQRAVQTPATTSANQQAGQTRLNTQEPNASSNIAAAATHNNKSSVPATTAREAATPATSQQAATTAGTPAIATANTALSAAENDLSKTQGRLPAIAHPAEPSLAVATPSSEADPVALMLARLDDQAKQMEQAEKQNKKNSKDKGSERLWTSVGFAAGTYSMVTSGTGTSNLSGSLDQASLAITSNNELAKSVVREQASAPGTSYSVGLNLGAKLATRWVLQGGVNYLTQSSAYTTNAAVGSAGNTFAAASINELKNSTAGRSNARVINTAEYRVNSSLQYFSVPLQAGYLAINRAFGLQFNAGVSTDLFLKNTLTPEGGSFEKTTQTRADDSPYRSVNFSGLVGTEFSYRFGPHYRVAVNPGLRYPFSSIYKSDISVSAMPLIFDVGLKFRYIFH